VVAVGVSPKEWEDQNAQHDFLHASSTGTHEIHDVPQQ